MPSKIKRGTPDLDALLNELSARHPGPLYTADTRYRDYRALFLGSDLGRRVLWDILKICRLYKASFDPDPHITALNEGMRNVGLKILDAINAEPSEPQVTATREERNG